MASLKFIFSLVLSSSLFIGTSRGRQAADYPSDDAFNPKLVSYRLEVKNLDFTVLEDYQGEKIVVRMGLSNATEQQTRASLRLNPEGLAPFHASIPPYIGLGARKFTAKLWVGSAQGVNSLDLIFDSGETDDLQTLHVPLNTLKPNQWNEVELSDPNLGNIERPLTGIRVEAALAGGAQGEIYLADAVLTTDTGKTYALLTTDMPLMLTGMTTPLATVPAQKLPERDSLTLGGYDIQNPEWFADLPDMAKFMKEHFPDADFVIAPVWTPYPILAQRLKQLPLGVFFQFQKAQSDPGYLAAINGLPANSSGKTYTSVDNTVEACNPLTQQVLKDQIDYAASLGVNNFKDVDYVWPYTNGPWGYDPATVAAEREDLTGQDEGLDLLAGPGAQKAGLIHFWDYFEQNHGLRLDPKDIGIQDWGNYDPATDRAATDLLQHRRLYGLHIALIHYEWLRQAQRFGRWAKRVGGKEDYTLNGENWENGGDYAYLTRLVDAGTPYCEYFGSPSVMRFNYSVSRTYVHAADLANKRLGLITEIGSGGHGENYLDPEVGSLYAYEAAAVGFRNYHSEWAESRFKEMSNPKNAYSYDRFSAWMTQASGFRRARRDGVSCPDTNVLSVGLGYALYGHINGDESFVEPLSDFHVNFQQADTISAPDWMDKANVIFYGPDCSPARMTQQLQDWMAKGGKTLVTHSFIPLALDYGQAEPTRDAAVKAHGFPTFQLLPEFKGLKLDSSGRWMPSGFHLLLGTNDMPLLSELDLPNNNRIFYLHDEFKNLSKEEVSDAMNKLIELLQLPQLVVEKPELGDSVMAELFQHGQTKVLSLWNRTCLDNRNSANNNSNHLLPDRGGNKFNPKLRPYPYLEPGAKCGAEVPVAAEGTYRVYRFFADKNETVTVGPDKMLSLTVEGTAMEQFYFAPDCDEFRQEIEKLHKQRVEVAPFFLDITKNSKGKL